MLFRESRAVLLAEMERRQAGGFDPSKGSSPNRVGSGQDWVEVEAVAVE